MPIDRQAFSSGQTTELLCAVEEGARSSGGRLEPFVSAVVRHPIRVAGVMDAAVAIAVCLAFGFSLAETALLTFALVTALAVDADRHRRLRLLTTSAVRPALLGAAVGFAGVVLVDPGDGRRAALTTIVVVAGLLCARSLLFASLRAARRRGYGLQRTLILGAGVVATSIAKVVARRREYGLLPVGFVDDVPATPDLELPVFSPSAGLHRLLRTQRITRVIIAFGRTRELEFLDDIRASAGSDVQFYVLPRFFELGAMSNGPAVDDMWGFPLVWLRPAGIHVASWRLKRLLDVVVGGALLILAAPLMAVIALAVRGTSPGPALFRQERVGMDGRVYEILKFRSMRPNADSDTQWSVDTDDRVTPLGRVLRRTHCDELPQLWNVIRGDMSLVGPRPERPLFAERFTDEIPGYHHRHRVPAGLTGLAQVNGLWGDTSIRERARFDNLYIEQWSLAQDLKILLNTVPTLLGRQEDDLDGSGGEATTPVASGPPTREDDNGLREAV